MAIATYYTKLTEYFRCSVLDAERLSPNTQALLQAVKPSEFSVVKKDVPFAIAADVWLRGQLNEQITQSIFLVLFYLGISSWKA